MYLSNLVPLLLVAPASLALRLPGHSNARRHAVDAEHARRAEAFIGERDILPKVKGKRLVKKKRASTCAPQAGFNATLPSGGGGSSASASSPASASASASSSSIGDNNWAGPSASASSTTPSASASPTPSKSPSSNSDWVLTDRWQGSNFFDNFNFWSWGDPTHGTVNYLNAGDAWNSGLIGVNGAGHAIMGVETTPQVSGARKSIRIHGNKVWTGGMVLMDAVHMPYGCGTWPAWWQNGPNWPYGGEIDILEGVNAFTQNQVSLHTGAGCTMPGNQNDLQLGTLTTGNYNSYDCASYNTANQGCGVRDQSNPDSYGSAFNNVGGGVYAMVWDKQGIRVWWFPRSRIPSDITNETPDPTGWGKPVADFPSDSCDPYTYFYDNYNIFDTTLCGDWAGADSVWNYAGYAGQDQSCAAITGHSTCSDFVLNSGASFADQYWEVSYVKYFNSTSQV